MPLVFKPMKEKDYLNSGGEVTEGYDKDLNNYLTRGLYSTHIFGDRPNKSDEWKDTSRDNVRGYITLCKPVINYILAGSTGSLLAKVLGMREKDMKDIQSFTLVYSKSANKLVNPTNIEDTRDMLCCGEIIKKMIDELDIQLSIKNELTDIILENFMRSGTTREIGVITKDNGQYPLLGGFYYTPNSYALSRLNSVYELETITSFFETEYLKTGKERIVYLLNLKNKDNIYGMLLEHLTVLPAGIRPTFSNRHDPMTVQYNAIIGANNSLKFTDKGDYTQQEVIQLYKSLNRLVNGIVTKYFDEKRKNYKSALQEISGKHGLIRGNMLSKRADYSGRSIIVVNPKLSLDQCGIPAELIPKLFNYHHIKALKEMGVHRVSEESTEVAVKQIQNAGILDNVPVLLNRAPTLHKLSFLGYYPIVTQSKAIELNPLACPGFNADFDGDAMAVHVPLSDAAIWETKSLMLSTHNLFIPANGKCTVVPRQEIIYGLNVATSDKYTLGEIKKTYDNLEDVKEDVMNHKIKVYETVSIGSKKNLAGKFALMWCLPADMHSNIFEVTKDSINKYVEDLLDHCLQEFKTGIDRMVLLGFRLAMLYAPPISLLSEIKDEFLLNPFEQFHKNMETATMLYEKGFEEETSYNYKFNKELDAVQDEVMSRISKGVGENNGFVRMVESGARGTKDNLVQIYSFKGRILKSAQEAFNAVIENSFTKQLTPLEHFMSAYGARKGVIDKVHRTSETGYAMRRMWHTTSDTVIVSEDCGTTTGLAIRKSDLSKHIRIDTDDENKKKSEVDKVFYDMIVGRYMAMEDKLVNGELNDGILRRIDEFKNQLNSQIDNLTKESILKHIQSLQDKITLNNKISASVKTKDYLIDKALAMHLVTNYEKIVIRSPIKCKNPCCAKCYGVDLGIQGDATVGLPIGFISAQSIGEPGTQLTMRTFHKGGVAGKADVTSDFDRLKAFIDMAKIGENKTLATYDPVAWASGEVIEKPMELGKKVISIAGSKKTVQIDINAELKKVVEKGEGLCVQQGDHDPNEVAKYLGVEEAQIYLLYAMYHTYLGKASINIKHFEVLVASMTLHLVTRTDRPDLKIGEFYTSKELLSGRVDATKYTTVLKGTKSVPLLKQNAMSNILMEDIVKGISRAVLMGHVEKFDGSLPAIALGLKPKLGTYFPNFVNERFRKERCREC